MKLRREFSGSVLVVEDSAKRLEWFREKLPCAKVATNPVDGVAAVRSRPDVVFLDFDLGSANSLGVAHLLADDPPAFVVIHSANERGAKLLKSILPSAWVLPFASFGIEGREIVVGR